MITIHAAETASFDDSPQEHPLEAEPCDQNGEARGVRLSSRSRRTYGLIGELGAFSPGLKPGICKINRSRGFSTLLHAPVYRSRAFALVAGGPVLSPERPMTTRTAPVSRSSPL